ncbi:MAG: FeoB-associated Cys-rich membrane protein [Desulfarculaceae bacterium]|nr:FeoB-associated Cys-rich membrane protein [Desulfarculaceae bacterium]MCF8071121.1 FeoB-associated Cys-rich membrane protein [Desulfarculaceae bacterium]MCF8101276.1 FeoB-associated Cys-rich membrane protein [Desulfarculaceae bacterium]MCF8115175.1 FeoB-associated Cys-rich membrane protein [Desulfarculaceae bacterium]
MGQLIIVLALVGLTVAWLARRWWRAARQGPACRSCCGSCACRSAAECGCAPKPQTITHPLPKEK